MRLHGSKKQVNTTLRHDFLSFYVCFRCYSAGIRISSTITDSYPGPIKAFNHLTVVTEDKQRGGLEDAVRNSDKHHHMPPAKITVLWHSRHSLHESG